jgi:hypothetical protein
MGAQKNQTSSHQKNQAVPEKKSNDSSKSLAIMLLVGALLLLVFGLGNETKMKSLGGAPAVVKSEKFEKAVNKHLMTTNEQLRMQEQRMLLENARSTKEIDANFQKPAVTRPTDPIDLSHDNRAADIANLMGRGEKQNNAPLDPNDIIQRELFTKEKMDEYSKAYRDEYARQFVENARRGGYKVQLSDDYKVMSVVPIKKPVPNKHEQLLNANSNGLE